jgi:hypothetical protein
MRIIIVFKTMFKLIQEIWIRQEGFTRKIRRFLTPIQTQFPKYPPLDGFKANAPVETNKLACASLYKNQQQPWREGIMPTEPIPSLMSPDESQAFYWMAKNLYKGFGAIVDMGPLAGNSTYAFVTGLVDGGHVYEGKHKIFSYDLWNFCSGWEPLFPGCILNNGDDIKPYFIKNMGEYAHWVLPHKGDLSTYYWYDGPIEILFVDAAKTPELWFHIQTNFIPSLIPGRSILIQQDFVCSECPWIHVFQGVFRDYFTPIDSPEGGTVAFIYEKKIPKELLLINYWLQLSLEERADQIKYCEKILVNWWSLCVSLSRANLYAISGETKKSRQIIVEVLDDPRYDRGIEFDVKLVEEVIDTT